MAIQIQLRSGTTTEHSTFTGAVGELTYDTEKKRLRVHDGSTVGGKVVDDPTRDVTSQVSNATETVAGKAEIATQAEANTGTDDATIITPKKLLAGVKNHLNVSGNAPMYACRAWVNFNGTGTPTIRASGNVSSITDNGVGDYTINFTTAMPDANYSFSGFCNFTSAAAAGILSFGNDFSMSAGSLRVKAANTTTGGTQDSPYITVSVFR